LEAEGTGERIVRQSSGKDRSGQEGFGKVVSAAFLQRPGYGCKIHHKTIRKGVKEFKKQQ
jgi:hypothetical protein